MAYGVKYRLEFSDVLGYRKKIEIHKKDYTGSILPMIGTRSPVVISWQSSDDFYKAIIGKQMCTEKFINQAFSLYKSNYFGSGFCVSC